VVSLSDTGWAMAVLETLLITGSKKKNVNTGEQKKFVTLRMMGIFL
jgi:hypothetical protein